MQLNLENFQFGKQAIIAAAAVFFATLLWIFFLAATGFTVNDLFTFKLQIVFDKLLTINFLLFLVFFPLPIALMAAFAKRMDEISLIMASMLSTLFALIAGMAAFPGLQGLWIGAIFYLIAVPLLIDTANVRYKELKRWITVRTMGAAAGRAVTIVTIGLAVLSIATMLPQQEQYIEKFEDFIVDVATGFTSDQTQGAISSSSTDMIIEGLVSALDSQILKTPEFRKLRDKSDEDVVAFVTMTDGIRDSMNSPEYKQLVEQQISGASSRVMQEIDIMDIIKQQVPFFATLEKFLWLLHALFLAGMFSLLGAIIIKPLAMVYGLVAAEALSLLSPETGKKNN